MGKKSRKKKRKNAEPESSVQKRKNAFFNRINPEYRYFPHLLAGFTFLIYLLIVVDYSGSPFSDGMIADSDYYVSWAKEISHGELLNQAPFHQAPGYALFLGLVFRVFGQKYMAVYLIQVLLALISVLLVYKISRRFFDRTISSAAMAGSALCGPLVFYTLKILPESIAVFLLLSSLYGLLYADNRWKWLLTGVVMGVLTLFRAQGMLLLPPALLFLFLYRSEPLPRNALRALQLTGGFILALLPVTTVNYLKSGDLIPVSWNGGIVFYLGNSPGANGAFKPIDGVSEQVYLGQDDVKTMAERATGKQLSPNGVSRYWFGKGVEFIRNNPRDATILLLRKLRYFFAPREVANMYYLSFERKEYTRTFWILLIGYFVILPFFAVGCIDVFSRFRERFILLVPVAVSLFTTTVYYFDERFRMLCVPFMLIIGAAGACRLFTLKKDRLFRIGVLVVCGLLFGALAIPRRDEISPESSMLYMSGMMLYDRHDYQAALRAFNKSYRMELGYPANLRDLSSGFGMALCGFTIGEKREEAVRFYIELFRKSNPEMRRFIQACGEYNGIRAYIAAHPELLSGN